MYIKPESILGAPPPFVYRPVFFDGLAFDMFDMIDVIHMASRPHILFATMIQ